MPQKIFPMHLAPRCGARTRRGAACQQPATAKGKCRMHGGAKGSGAPKGNKNALKHGRYTAEAIAERRLLSRLLKEAHATMNEIREAV